MFLALALVTMFVAQLSDAQTSCMLLVNEATEKSIFVA